MQTEFSNNFETVFIQSEPGRGVIQRLNELARTAGLKTVTIHAGILDGEIDFARVLGVDYVNPENLELTETLEQIIVDETQSASIEVLTSIRTLLKTKTVSGVFYPQLESVVVVASGGHIASSYVKNYINETEELFTTIITP